MGARRCKEKTTKNIRQGQKKVSLLQWQVGNETKSKSDVLSIFEEWVCLPLVNYRMGPPASGMKKTDLSTQAPNIIRLRLYKCMRLES